MNRRDFVRASALVGSAALASGALLGPRHAGAAELGYRATDDGRILSWDIAGQRWREVVDLGPCCKVVEIRHEKAGLRCRVAVGDHRFQLYSHDGISWTTSPIRRSRAGASRRGLLSSLRAFAETPAAV